MRQNLVRVEPLALTQTEQGCMIFLGNGKKVMVMHIDPYVGDAINLALAGQKTSRPMTHDLFNATLQSFGARLRRCVIVEMDEKDTFYARLIMEAQNEVLHRKIVEIDARPSDAIALAVRNGAPMYFVEELWESLADATKLLESIRRGEQ